MSSLETRVKRDEDMIKDAVLLASNTEYQVLQGGKVEEDNSDVTELDDLQTRLFQFEYDHADESIELQNPDSVLDYDKLFYTNSNVKDKFYIEEDYLSQTEESTDTKMETMTHEEAEETMQEMQYSKITGSGSVTLEKRRRLSNWLLFNRVRMGLWESLNAVTRDIDYSSLN